MADVARGTVRHAGVLAGYCGGSAVVVLALLGCGDSVAPSGRRGTGGIEPRAGLYVVAEFDYLNTCAEPHFELHDRAATARSASFDLTPDSDHSGTVVLNGVLNVPSPMPGTGNIAIFEGPDTGEYTISGDTLLRLLFPREVNAWVGVLRFARYQAGQLAGSSQTRCRSLLLRLEQRP